jgi:hypothetical protein
MITPAEARQIDQHLRSQQVPKSPGTVDKPLPVLCIDRRQIDTVETNWILARQWHVDGVVVQAPEREIIWSQRPLNLPDGEYWLVLYEPKTSQDAEIDSFADELARLPNFVCFTDGELTGRAPPRPQTLPRLRIGGRNSLTVNVHDWPVQVQCEVNEHSRRRVISVEAQTPGLDLPLPAIFQLPRSKGPLQLKIDIQPSVHGDRWVAMANDQPCQLAHPPQDQRPLDRLYLIFDRTSHAEGFWSSARSLHFAAAAKYGDFPSEEDHHETVPAGDFNLPIRNGVAAGICQALPADVKVTLSWFADNEGDGRTSQLHWPVSRHLSPPARGSGVVGEFSGPDLSDALLNCPYSPGLDLWDPLELALDEAAERISADEGCNWGVLIVGNSPPNPPSDPANSLWNLLRFNGDTDAGWHGKQFTSTFRRRTNVMAIRDRLLATDTPLLYLFLTQLRPVPSGQQADKDVQEAFTVYLSLQNLLYRSLADCFDLDTCLAEQQRISTAVTVALQSLAKPALSHVKVTASKQRLEGSR